LVNAQGSSTILPLFHTKFLQEQARKGLILTVKFIFIPSREDGIWKNRFLQIIYARSAGLAFLFQQTKTFLDIMPKFYRNLLLRSLLFECSQAQHHVKDQAFQNT
jgi:hypothetical protein